MIATSQGNSMPKPKCLTLIDRQLKQTTIFRIQRIEFKAKNESKIREQALTSSPFIHCISITKLKLTKHSKAAASLMQEQQIHTNQP